MKKVIGSPKSCFSGPIRKCTELVDEATEGISNILTQRAYIGNGENSDLFCNKSLGGRARHDLVPFRRHFDTLLTAVFFATTLDGLTSFFTNQQRKKCM